MKKSLLLIPLFFASYLTTFVSVVNAQTPCGIARPGVECINPDGTIRPGEEPGGGSGNEEEPGGGDGILSQNNRIENPLRIDNIQDLLAAILSAVVQIAIPFLVLAVMWVGFLFVAARGNPEKLTKAKQALFFTLLGALIILGAQTLSIVLSGTIRELTEGVNN